MVVLSILLTILKWIGIILLSLLCLILFLCLFILFVPIKYRMSAIYTDDKKYFKAKISWILNILRFKIEYNLNESKFEYSLKCFFYSFFASNKKVKSKKIKPIKNKCVKEKENIINHESEKNDVKQIIYKNKVINSDKKESEIVFNKKENNKKEKSFVKRIIHYFKKIPNKLKKIKEKFENKKYTINNLYDTIKRRLNNINRWKEFLTHKISKRAYEHIKLCLKKLWKSVRPKKWDLYLEFGFNDIATTGKTLAFISAVFPNIRGSFNVFPDFEEKVFLLNTDLYGRIRLISLLICFIKIYKDKDVKKTYIQFKKLK